MAKVVITLKANLDPDSDIENIKEEANNRIEEFGGEVGKVEVEEIAFGLKAVNFVFILDESKGSTESLENDIASIEGVSSVEITDVRRTIG